MDKTECRGHVLVVPYPTQGHINPSFQFCKRLASKGFKATLAITTFVSNTNPNFASPPSTANPSSLIHFDTFSDGYDEGGFATAESIDAYLNRFKAIGSASLAQLIKKHADSKQPIDCIVYDSFLQWALDVAKQHGVVGAAFFTQACAVNCILYYVHRGLLKLPGSQPVKIPGLPALETGDMPGFIGKPGSYPAYFKLVLDQCYSVDKADYILVNTYYELEAEIVDSMNKISSGRMLTIGPTIPSLYVDNRVAGDKAYGLSLYTPNSDVNNWISNKPPGSVVYVSFGSLTILEDHQMKELAWGLKASNYYFLWVILDSEEAKLPENFSEQVNGKGLIIKWSSQLEVLANEAVGCFLTHCGWNSTLEALCLGVPMVGMPVWTDQPTNGKLIQDVWRVGLRVKADDEGLVTREEVETCIRRVMEGEEGKEIKANAKRWSKLAKEAVSEGGSSDKNIDAFLSKFASF